MIFQFSGYSIDIDRRELRCGAKLIEIGPQVFDLLVDLIRNRDRGVSKDDLLDAIWEGRVVSRFDAHQPYQCGPARDRRHWCRPNPNQNDCPQRVSLHR